MISDVGFGKTTNFTFSNERLETLKLSKVSLPKNPSFSSKADIVMVSKKEN